MNTFETISDNKNRLLSTKESLKKEIDNLYKEIDQVENDAFGAMNKIKLLVAAQVGRGAGLEAVMGEGYARLKRGGFRDAQDYIDHLKSSIEEARQSISKIDQVLINIENIERDMRSLENQLGTWAKKADDLLN